MDLTAIVFACCLSSPPILHDALTDVLKLQYYTRVVLSSSSNLPLYPRDTCFSEQGPCDGFPFIHIHGAIPTRGLSLNRSFANSCKCWALVVYGKGWCPYPCARGKDIDRKNDSRMVQKQSERQYLLGWLLRLSSC